MDDSYWAKLMDVSGVFRAIRSAAMKSALLVLLVTLPALGRMQHDLHHEMPQEMQHGAVRGQNHRSDHTEHSWTAETALHFNEYKETLGRIRALTVGYTKDVYRDEHIRGGVGGNVTAYGYPSAVKNEYATARWRTTRTRGLRLH
jgi:hypothetical protein